MDNSSLCQIVPLYTLVYTGAIWQRLMYTNFYNIINVRDSRPSLYRLVATWAKVKQHFAIFEIPSSDRKRLRYRNPVLLPFVYSANYNHHLSGFNVNWRVNPGKLKHQSRLSYFRFLNENPIDNLFITTDYDAYLYIRKHLQVKNSTSGCYALFRGFFQDSLQLKNFLSF